MFFAFYEYKSRMYSYWPYFRRSMLLFHSVSLKRIIQMCSYMYALRIRLFSHSHLMRRKHQLYLRLLICNTLEGLNYPQWKWLLAYSMLIVNYAISNNSQHILCLHICTDIEHFHYFQLFFLDFPLLPDSPLNLIHFFTYSDRSATK